MKNDFYVVLPSNSCPLTQPDNTSSHFIIDYVNAIRLSGLLNQWQVALTEFKCIYSSLSNEHESIIRYKKYQKSNSFHFSFNLDIGVIKYKRNIQDFDVELTDDRLFKMTYIKPFRVSFHNDARHIGFKEKYNQSTLVTDETGYTEHCIVGSRQLQFDSCVISGDLFVGEYVDDVVKFPTDVMFTTATELCKYIEVHFSSLFKRIEITGNRFVRFLIADNITEIEIGETVAMFLGLSSTKYVNKGQVIKGDKRPILKVASNNMYIFANVVEPIYIGNQQLPLLKHVCFEKKYKYGDTVYFSFKKPMYVPVSIININKIEINITDEKGKIISFSHGSKTSLTLHFRKNE